LEVINIGGDYVFVFGDTFTITAWVNCNSTDGITRPLLEKAARNYEN
jgi:hypothetical protein